jgi:hypothetical protein
VASIVLLLAIGGTLNVLYTPVADPMAVQVQDCDGYDAGGSDLACKKIGTGNRLVVLFGDSHVLPLVGAFSADPAMTYMFVSIPGCPPLVGLERYDGIGHSSNCDKPGQLAHYAQQIASLQPEKTILVGRWTLYMHGWQKKNVLQKKHHLMQLETGETGLTPQQVVARGVDTTVKFFTRTTPQSKLFILEQVPDIQMFGHVRRLSAHWVTASRAPPSTLGTKAKCRCWLTKSTVDRCRSSEPNSTFAMPRAVRLARTNASITWTTTTSAHRAQSC